MIEWAHKKRRASTPVDYNYPLSYGYFPEDISESVKILYLIPPPYDLGRGLEFWAMFSGFFIRCKEFGNLV